MRKSINLNYLFALSLFISSSLIIGCNTKLANTSSSTYKESKRIIAAVNPTVWGSSAAPFPGEKINRIDAWKRLNEKIKSSNGGYGLEGRRTYDKGLPASWSVSVMAEDVGLCKVSFGSIKPDWTATANGSNYDSIKKFVQSIPDNRVVYLTFFHEPEDNIKQNGYSAALLQSAFAKFVDAVLDAKKPNVHPCFVLMSYTFRSASGRNPDDFNLAAKLKPNQLDKVIAGVDGYSKTPETVSAKSLFDPCFTKIASWGFTRFGIFETATKADSIQGSRARWIKELGGWVNSRKDIDVVSWFHSGVGQNAGPTGWFLGNRSLVNDAVTLNDDDGSIAAYSQLLKH